MHNISTFSIFVKNDHYKLFREEHDGITSSDLIRTL